MNLHSLRRNRLLRLFHAFFANKDSSLAYTELYLTIAALVRRVDIELFDTNIDDIRLVRDFIVGAPRKGGRGLRIIAKRLAS